jgi:hypothetical protein
MNLGSHGNLTLQSWQKYMTEKKTTSPETLLGKLDTCPQGTKLNPCLSHCTNINSKWIKDLNIKPEPVKLMQERTENTSKLIGLSNGLLLVAH